MYNLDDILQSGECETVEFKSGFNKEALMIELNSLILESFMEG